MGRGRFVIAVFVILGLALPPIAPDAHAADTVVECDSTSEMRTDGHDGDTPVAAYVLRATWCIETTYETRTITDDTSGEPASDDSGETVKAKKKQKGKRGKKARRQARRAKSRPNRTTTRTERRVVSRCMTNFQLVPEPQALVQGVDLLGVTTTPVSSGDACASRSFRVVGRFGRDYIAGVPPGDRSVISQEIAGTTVENYPLGRFGQFDVTVSFGRDGGGTCDRCVPAFEFCDVRIVFDDDASCLRL